MNRTVAVLGLGSMGSMIATRLAKAGIDITVFNRTREKAVRWNQENGGQIAASPGSAVSEVEVAIICVHDDQAVRNLMDGVNGIWHGIGSGCLIIDHSTTSADTAREMHWVAAHYGVDYLDAPLFGSAKSVANGQIGIVAGGEQEAFSRAKELFQNYATSTILAGPSGAGQLMKMVNQICMAGTILSLCEAFRFAEAVGCDTKYVLASLAAGSAASWQLENRGKKMLERNFDGPGLVSLLSKDVDICVAEARRQGLRLPVVELMGKECRRLVKAGHGDWDAAGLISLVQTLRK